MVKQCKNGFASLLASDSSPYVSYLFSGELPGKTIQPECTRSITHYLSNIRAS